MDTDAVLGLLQAGFLLPGFGSNLVDEGRVELESDKLDLPKLTLEDVVREAVKVL